MNDFLLIACGSIGGFMAMLCLSQALQTWSRMFWLLVATGHGVIVGSGFGLMWGYMPSSALACAAGMVIGAAPFVITALFPRRTMTPEDAARLVVELDESSFDALCVASVQRMNEARTIVCGRTA